MGCVGGLPFAPFSGSGQRTLGQSPQPPPLSNPPIPRPSLLQSPQDSLPSFTATPFAWFLFGWSRGKGSMAPWLGRWRSTWCSHEGNLTTGDVHRLQLLRRPLPPPKWSAAPPPPSIVVWLEESGQGRPLSPSPCSDFEGYPSPPAAIWKGGVRILQGRCSGRLKFASESHEELDSVRLAGFPSFLARDVILFMVLSY
jgi:hypothetical protein